MCISDFTKQPPNRMEVAFGCLLRKEAAFCAHLVKGKKLNLPAKKNSLGLRRTWDFFWGARRPELEVPRKPNLLASDPAPGVWVQSGPGGGEGKGGKAIKFDGDVANMENHAIPFNYQWICIYLRFYCISLRFSWSYSSIEIQNPRTPPLTAATWATLPDRAATVLARWLRWCSSLP